MRKHKRLIAAFMAAGMLAGSLAGCSGSGKTAEPTTAAGAENTTAAAQTEGEKPGEASGETVTLRMSWWGGDSRHERILAVIDAFQKANPDIVIEPEYSAFADYRDKFTMQLTSGDRKSVV